jgi:hypothetical protein
MINAKISKNTPTNSNEERLFKLLESIDWKLWEMMKMMKAVTEQSPDDKKTAGE